MLESTPGLYRNILVFDFTSLYPSLIRTFNIDPLTLRRRRRRRTPTCARRAARRSAREEGILPALVARLWAERAAAKRAGDAIASQATKILMNSLFGVLGSPASRLFSPAVANAITLAGQHVIRLAAAGGRAPRPSRHLRRHRLALRRRRRDDDGGARARPASACAARSRPTSPRRSSASSAAGATSCSRSRRSTRASSCPRCGAPATAARSAMPGSSARSSRSSGSKRCDATGARSRAASSASSWRACCATSRSTRSCATFVADAARRRASTTSSRTGRPCARPLADYTRTTPPHVKAARKAGIGGPAARPLRR